MPSTPVTAGYCFQVCHLINLRYLSALLAEQNLEVALRLSDRGYVIDNGTIQYHGTRDDLSSNDVVRNQYLCV